LVVFEDDVGGNFAIDDASEESHERRATSGKQKVGRFCYDRSVLQSPNSILAIC
jgi:hypothetical protein